jgi:hypothetical protein
MLTINLFHTRASKVAGLVRCSRCASLVAKVHRGWCRKCETAAHRRYRNADPERYAAHREGDAIRHPARLMLDRAKARAKAQGLPFDLTVEDVTIPERCPVLGIELVRTIGRHGFLPASPSLDRFVPSLGYVRGNVVVISNRANMLKRDATVAEIEALARWMRKVSP